MADRKIIIEMTETEFGFFLDSRIQRSVNLSITEYFKAMPSQQAHEFISAKQTAAILKISLPTLRKYTREGQIIGYRMRHSLRYRKDQVEDALKAIRTIKHSREY